MVGGTQNVVISYFSISGRSSVALNLPRASYTNTHAPRIHCPKIFPQAHFAHPVSEYVKWTSFWVRSCHSPAVTRCPSG